MIATDEHGRVLTIHYEKSGLRTLGQSSVARRAAIDALENLVGARRKNSDSPSRAGDPLDGRPE